MRIRVVNPNTTASMTALIEASARAVAGPGTVLDAVTSAAGPASIEGHYDEAVAVPGLLAAVAAGEQEGVDGYVVACFGEPGLDAARELAHALGPGRTVVTLFASLATDAERAKAEARRPPADVAWEPGAGLVELDRR